ncbi:hypothetical protein [Sigmofec virus UA08Rod_6800]|uniref:Uncharacterized protein n=1 Tax=Sigmofec virus UA08Rod_6800 TaxID=2929240 RepID=A0A976R8F5_9VIRU|nr:hypothetical protein [Sigmofec virus UA08Rod_6800]
MRVQTLHKAQLRASLLQILHSPGLLSSSEVLEVLEDVCEIYRADTEGVIE